MARWASPEQVAEYLSKPVGSVRADIFKQSELGRLFHRVGSLRRADLDEVDSLIRKDCPCFGGVKK
jgi:hypothetical protein